MLAMRNWILSAALLSVAAYSAAAQAKKPFEVLPTKFRLVKIKTTGSQLYTEQEIIAASGLKLNSQISQEDLQTASNLLGQSGAFSNVQYRYTPDTANQVEAEFYVVDNASWLPVIFDNFVWFARQQLIDQLHARLPLFKGNLPQVGSLNDQVRAALDEMLATHGVQAKTAMELHSEIGKPIDAAIFRAEGPKVTLQRWTGRTCRSWILRS